MLFRNVKLSDISDIYELAIKSGIGITTLPKDKDVLKKRIELSISSISKKFDSPFNEYYLFVLEDTKTGKVVGTAAIEASVGLISPAYSYKVSKIKNDCIDLNIHNEYNLLSLTKNYQKGSEICTLFLDPSYRINSNGLLLSLARFLFIANFPERFFKKIVAEMRGVSDEDGNSPFWDGLGFNFFNMSFAEADRLSISTNKQFITDLMPKHPIYVKLLPKTAQDVIGQPHHLSKAAMNILFREGFSYSNHVDIFDAGPTLEAKKERIKTIAKSSLLKISDITNNIKSKPYLIANNKLDYKATVSNIIINNKEKTCAINQNTAEILQLKLNDLVRVSQLG